MREEKIFRKPWNGFPEREIGVVRDGDLQKSIQYFEDRFSQLENKIQDIETRISEDSNKGSFINNLIHIQRKLPEHDGLGDYQKINQKLQKLIDEIHEVIDRAFSDRLDKLVNESFGRNI